MLGHASLKQKLTVGAGSGSGSMPTSSMDQRTNVQLRLAKMSFYLILIWLVSWTPLALLAMMNSFTSQRRASATAVFIANTMTKLGPAFDVLIYGISHPKIKKEFVRIIRRLLFVAK